MFLLAILAGAGCSAPGPAPAPVASVPAATFTATAAPSDTPAPSPAPPTVAPNTPTAPPATPTPTAAPTATPIVTATLKTATAIRSGPGLVYGQLGTLAPGLAVRVRGQTADKLWLEIDFQPSPTGSAWLPAAAVSLTADSLPVAAAPPTPTPAPVAVGTIAAPRPALPIATPAIVFGSAVLRADQVDLAPGACTTLRWDLDNWKELYLNLGVEEVPVPGHEARSVCVDETSTFVLRAVMSNGATQIYGVTVNVSEDCQNKNTEITRLDVSATQIKKGQLVQIAWDVSCSRGVYFKEGAISGAHQKMLRHDSVEVQPDQTATYRLFVIALDGSEIRRDIKIDVTP